MNAGIALVALSVAGCGAAQQSTEVPAPRVASGDAALAANAAQLSTTAPAGSLFPSDADLHEMLRYLVEDGETPGIVLGIIEPDGSTRVLTHGGAGAQGRALDGESVFEIASVNKTFTGVLLALAVQKGEVTLEDPVSRHLPAHVRVPSRNGREITLLDLATHFSGLPRMPDDLVRDRANPYEDYRVDQLYAFLGRYELERDPGAEGEYSNLGYGLLGHALARAAGAASYEELVRSRILEPLGMSTTGYVDDDYLADRLVDGHFEVGQPVPHWNVSDAFAGAGGLASSTEDMMRWLRANMGDAPPELAAAMRMAQQPQRSISTIRSIGLGWQIVEEDGRTIVTHDGTTDGFKSGVAFDPERRTGYVLFANSKGFDDDLGMDFMRRGAPASLPEVAVVPATLARYVGTYRLNSGRAALVQQEDDGALTLRMPGNVRFRMYADSDSTFFFKRAPWRVRFTPGDGDAVSMTLDANGQIVSAERVAEGDGVAVDDGPRNLPLSAEERAMYVGTFTLRSGERVLDVRVFERDGQLGAQATGQRPSRMLYQGDHRFVLGVDENIQLVFTVENGVATVMTLHQNGRVIPAPRTQ